MAEELTEEKLSNLAEDLAQDDKLPKLGQKLGFKKNQVDKYIKTNKRNENDEGTSAMLFDWKKKTFKSQQIPNLVKALIDSDLANFAQDFFPAEAQRQIQGQMEGPTSSASNANSTSTSERTVTDKSQMEGPSTSSSDANSSSSPERNVTDKELMNLAGCLHSDYYMPVAINLGVPYADYDNIKRENASSLKIANFQMLKKWMVKENGGKVKDLDKALRDADCGGLQYKEKE